MWRMIWGLRCVVPTDQFGINYVHRTYSKRLPRLCRTPGLRTGERPSRVELASGRPGKSDREWGSLHSAPLSCARGIVVPMREDPGTLGPASEQGTELPAGGLRRELAS